MNEFLEVIGKEILTEQDIRMMNPIKLAYLGDAVYEMYIRTYIINNFKGNVNYLNKNTVKYVRASAQASIVKTLESKFSEQEMTIVKRGRNQKSISVPKNASITEYKLATGFESLIGHLYLTGSTERIYEIIKMGIEVIESQEQR